MRFLSHRGLWQNPSEKNTLSSFKRSIDLGFGIETDIRDRDADLVISHDMARAEQDHISELFKLYTYSQDKVMLALNIKSDGIASLLQEYLNKNGVEDYFVFDMSIPDTLHYSKLGMKFFVRRSEYEQDSPLYEDASGVWIDMFETNWVKEKLVSDYLSDGKCVCLVSPELHKRDYQEYWEYMKTWNCLEDDRLYLCTDFPVLAKKMILNETD